MKKVLLALITILLLFYSWKQYRHFYKVDDIVFTVWKTTKGYCYITPYIYLGINLPKDNYIKVSNLDYTNIYIDDNTTLYLYNDGSKVECQFTRFKCIYSPPPEIGAKKISDITEEKLEEYTKREQLWSEKWNMCEKTMSSILLDIRYMNVSIKSHSDKN